MLLSSSQPSLKRCKGEGLVHLETLGMTYKNFFASISAGQVVKSSYLVLFCKVLCVVCVGRETLLLISSQLRETNNTSFKVLEATETSPLLVVFALA
jgi:hypothetical protein